MAKPTDKITVTMTRSEWNLFLAKATSHSVEARNASVIEFSQKNGLD